MPAVRLSRAAENDLLDIAIYTLDNWGEEQSLRYGDHIETCFQKLAANPLLGRGLRRWEPGRTSPKQNQIHISRILHERMLPAPAIFPSS